MGDYRSHPNPLLRRRRFTADIQNCSPYYRFMRWGCRMAGALFYRQRVYNRHHEPADGGVVYISNHQSFFDPIIVTNALSRPGNYMARDTLFRQPMFRRLIESLNAFPIQRNKADTGALKEAMRRLKQGRTVVVFPEGTRTRDGHIGPFLPGVSVLSQRAATWTVPVLIDGAYEAWPRTQVLPRPGRIFVEYAPAISQEEARNYSPAEFVEHVRNLLIEMQTRLRAKVGRPALRYE
ncbi:MAG: 1-acyl-sn-glycerol-3-phosphate acyltransferase [Phycisphaerae bacterium]|nr:1-acyl-sn-glycerol-3-phosphate acyltransferase [Phycisphaerae bacterium]